MASGLYTMGGSSTVVDNLAVSLSRKGVDVTVGALSFDKNPPPGIQSVKILGASNFLRLRRFLGDFDIIHSHHAITNYLALVKKRHFVYHYHGSPDFGRCSPFGFNVRFSIKAMHHAFDAVVAVSQTGRAELEQSFGLKNVYVVYNGVDTERFNPDVVGRFRRGSPQLLFVGNLYEHKNVQELVLAVRDLIKTYPETYLQIIGHGKGYPHLKGLVKRLSLGHNIELVGRVADNEIPSYFASCDLYVTASRWELFGLPILEAMACGKPVVASSIPPHAELLSESEAGALYKLGDKQALVQKIGNIYENHARYASNAWNFAKKHDWTVVADQIMNIYGQIALV